MSFTYKRFMALIVLNSLTGLLLSIGGFYVELDVFFICLVCISEMSRVFLRKLRGGSISTGGTNGNL